MQRSWGSGVRQRCPWLSCYYPAMVLCYRRGDRYLGGQVATFATPGCKLCTWMGCFTPLCVHVLIC